MNVKLSNYVYVSNIAKSVTMIFYVIYINLPEITTTSITKHKTLITVKKHS